MEKSLGDSIGEIMTQTELIYAKVIEYALLYGVKALFAILLLVGGFWLANRLTKVLDVSFRSKNVDPTIGVYLSRIFNAAFKILIVITAAGLVGVQTTSFIAVLGAAGLAVGLALQGSLANFAGGVLILLLRPFRVGDTVFVQGEEGVISAIDVFFTTLTKADNRRLILPNGPLIGGPIMNLTYEKNRRVELRIGVAYDSSLQKVEDTLLQMARKHPLVLQVPPPAFVVDRYGDSSIDIIFQVWTETANYPVVRNDMYRQVKEVFDLAGISIPFPQREIRMLGKTVSM